MRVSYQWLKELCPGLEAGPHDVAERLTRGGLEVESVEEFGVATSTVSVAEVVGVEPHPTRDKLRLVTVRSGDGPARVVCGAANVPAPGGRVALATLGTSLPAVGLTLEPRDIGGVTSAGMLCSERELGLAAESEGILILPGDAAVGTRLCDAVPSARDTVFEIGVTPNRPDALGHVGVARDVAALFGTEAFAPAVPEPARWASTSVESLVAVTIEDGERCPFYGASAVLDVTISPSPEWLRWRLFALGLRPISNVVDVTNLLLLEAGQPMHAFDLDLVRGGKIVVRRARPSERLRTLDGNDHDLVEDDLVICDAEGPTALAGVMGGETSEIREGTRRVLLECAYFTPQGVRRTARRHGLNTDSSHRFERGIDWGATPRVLDRAAALLADLTGGAVAPQPIHARGATLVVPTMRLRSKRLSALLGAPIPFDEACATLDRLGLQVARVDDEAGDRVATVHGASWRPDVTREVDLVEEVARIRGLDALPTVLPAIAPQKPRTSGKLERDAAELAASLGLSEAVTYSFVSAQDLAAVRAPAACVTLQNPLTEDRSVLRTSLLPGLLDVVRRARRHGEQTLRVFSVGAVFGSPAGAPSVEARPRAEDDAGTLPSERPSFAAVLAGPRPAYLARPEETDVWDAKGIAVEMVERLTAKRAVVTRSTEPPAHLHPRGAGEVHVEGALVAHFGPLHPDVIEAVDLGGPSMIVEVDLLALEATGVGPRRFRPIPRLPAVMRDLALVVPSSVPAGDVERVVRDAAGDLCESVALFDAFDGTGIPAGHRSLAFHLVYRDPNAATQPDAARTLTDQEVDARQAQIVEVARTTFGATLRT